MSNANGPSPFCIGNVVSEPEKFWGREIQQRFILDRLQKAESTSITGPRRIGKTSLARFLFRQCKKELGSTHDMVWLDGQSNATTTLSRLISAIVQQNG
jgi:ABC-type transporter Mla maintaining outer membrane lipid asymmetry ATPase subunit MlaF